MISPENLEKNPLSDLISDETFQELHSRGLLNKKSLRDLIIRKKYQMLREKNISAREAINILRKEYGYLQPDTLRKIVYNIK
jgi:hypothetical protein